jgi:hypothetical protein
LTHSRSTQEVWWSARQLTQVLSEVETPGGERGAGAVLDDDPYRRTWHRAQSIVGPDEALADEWEAVHTVSLRRGR